MKPALLLPALLVLATSAASRATLSSWQSAVTGGTTAPAKTLFTTVTGGSPILFDVGTLSGDRSFEFIVNSPSGGISQTMLGSQDSTVGRQGLKFDQCCNTGLYGMTDFGVADYNSTTNTDFGRDVDITFTSDGSTTNLYTDGIFRFNFPSGLAITGTQGLGAGNNFGVFFDVMAGDILSFASYDAALSPAEVAAHNTAFAAVPEPSGALLSGFAVLGVTCVRRRR